MIKFGDIAREVRETFKGDKTGVPVVGLENLIPGEMELNSFDTPEETTFTKSFHKGQILFGRRRAYQKKSSVATFDGICSGDITVIEAIPGKVYPELLPFIIANDKFFDHAIQGSAGSLSPRVKWEHLSSYELELPPIEDQKVLADKLWAAYRLKEAYQRLLAATDEMVKSQFLEMFGNPNYNEKGLPTTSLSKIADNWDSKRIPITSGNRISGIYPYYGASGIVDYVHDYIFDDKLLLISEDGANLKDRVTPIAFTVEGKCWVNNHAHILKFEDEDSRIYVEYFINYLNVEKYLTGMAQPKLNQERMNAIPITDPCEDYKKQFASIVRQADKSKFDGFKSQFLEMFGCEKYGWKYPTYKISSRFKIGTGGTPDRKKGDFYGGDIPWVKSTEVNFNEVWDTEETLNNDGLSNSNCKLYDPGAILLAMYGQGATRGRVAKLCIPATVNQAIAVIQVESPNLSEFVYNALKVNYNEIREMAVGGNQHNLNLNLVGQIQIPDAPIDKIASFNNCSKQADKSKYYELN